MFVVVFGCSPHRSVDKKILVSIHVIFNEIIPDPTAEYFSELEKLKMAGGWLHY